MKALMLVPLLLLACARDVQTCDANTMAAKAREAVTVCQAKGYAWLSCKDRPRILKELSDELSRCGK